LLDEEFEMRRRKVNPWAENITQAPRPPTMNNRRTLGGISPKTPTKIRSRFGSLTTPCKKRSTAWIPERNSA